MSTRSAGRKLKRKDSKRGAEFVVRCPLCHTKDLAPKRFLDRRVSCPTCELRFVAEFHQSIQSLREKLVQRRNQRRRALRVAKRHEGATASGIGRVLNFLWKKPAQAA